MNGLGYEMDEYEAGIDALESSDEFEWLGETGQWTGETDGEAVFDEVEEMELAAELLGVQSEEELEEFLGKLIRKAGGAVKSFARSSAGKALGGVLKNVARTALPMAGKVLGNMVLPGVGGMIGGKLASAAGRMFGLELEGMSPQDQEFEVARRFVRLSAAATRQAAQTPVQGSPVAAAKDAVLAAAQVHAPGLVGGAAAAGGQRRCTCGGRGGGAQRGRPGGAGGRPGGYGPRRGSVPTRGGYGGQRGGGYGGGYAAPRGGGYGGYGGAAAGGAGTGSSGSWVRRGNVLVVRLEG